MDKFKAYVEGVDYSFDVNAEDEQDALTTAQEYCELIGQPEWKDYVRIEKVSNDK